MGLLEEEWSGAGIADMVWSKEEGEESGGQPLHHHHHQELVKEVKGDNNSALVSSNDLLNNFGPLRIGVLENGRWDYFYKTTSSNELKIKLFILVSIFFRPGASLGSQLVFFTLSAKRVFLISKSPTQVSSLSFGL